MNILKFIKGPAAQKAQDVLAHGTLTVSNYLELFDKLPKNFVETKVKRFYARHGYVPNIENPQKFSEKLLTRILTDRDPNYLFYGTKLNSARFRSGHLPNELCFAERLKVQDVLSPSDFQDLPDSFVLKSSFGSGLNTVVVDKQSLDIDALCQTYNRELPKKVNAQGISLSGNVAIFETYLDDPSGHSTPGDYKFHCFNGYYGSSKMILQIDSGRFEDHRQSMFDEACSKLAFSIGGVPTHEMAPDLPQNIDTMFRVAKQMSSGFTYIRIDLYNIGGKIYFGEYTPFHQGGLGAFSDQKWDECLGEFWDFRLPTYQSTNEQ